jgi:ATP-binding cassette subfamily F protein 3
VSLITATNLAKAYGAQDVFAGVELALPHGARAALVGPNGGGKTTLLRILLGYEEPSAGTVSRARGLTVGYLPQEAEGVLAGERTLWDEMLTVFAGLRAQEAELRRLEAAMARPAERDAALERYAVLLERFEHAGGYTYETRIRQTLAGLGFEADDLARPLGQLSGGQKTRALLARLLLEQPQLLVLDEPTNHLDIAAVEWLERVLNDWPGGLLIVSHDRYFLDRVATAVWELSGGQLERFSGNYSAYLVQRAERRAQQQRAYAGQQERLTKEWDYIRRNIAGQNTRQAKGRLRRLERELGARRGHRLREDQITGLEERPAEAQRLRLRLGVSHRSGDRVLETEGLVVGHRGDPPLFSAPDLLLWRGECAALIGPNGAGKTTFLRAILGELEPLAGRVRLGASLKIGYFAQTQNRLDGARTVVEELLRVRPAMRTSEARDYLAQFLFSGDDVFKRIEMLSGGERARVALAILALEGANFLLLDEPTNHLDIPAQEVLQAVLGDFPGTILLVTHDRYLVDALATQVWALDRGGLTLYSGNYADYLAARERAAIEAAARATARESAGERRAGERRAGERRAGERRAGERRAGERDAAAARARKAELRAQAARERRLAELEAEIAGLEAEQAALTEAIEAASAARQLDRVESLGIEYARVEAQLQARLAEWETQA